MTCSGAIRWLFLGLAGLGTLGCPAVEPGLHGGIPLFPRAALHSGRFAVEAGVVYEIDLDCRVTLPYNSEELGLGGLDLGPIELEPAPSPFYSLGIPVEVRDASVRSEDHSIWLELATLERVPNLGSYEQARDAGREKALEALRNVRGPSVVDIDLVQAGIREYHLSGTVAFRIPEGIKVEALELERKVGGALVAFFISPRLPGEGLSVTLVAPPTRDGFEIEATTAGACPRLVMRRDQFM